MLATNAHNFIIPDSKENFWRSKFCSENRGTNSITIKEIKSYKRNTTNRTDHISANGLYFVALWSTRICTWYVRSEEFRQAIWSKCWTCDFSNTCANMKEKYCWILLQPLIWKQKMWWEVLSYFFFWGSIFNLHKIQNKNPNKLLQENASPNT